MVFLYVFFRISPELQVPPTQAQSTGTLSHFFSSNFNPKITIFGMH